MDEQSLKAFGAGGNRSAAPALAQDQQQFNEWLFAARTSDDVRNRIAVTGGTISKGVFGKCYLLVPNGQVEIATTTSDQSMRGQAANDGEYEKHELSGCSHNR